MSTPLNLVSLFNRRGSEVSIDGDDLLDAIDIYNFVGDLSLQNRERLLRLLVTKTPNADKIICEEIDNTDLLDKIGKDTAMSYFGLHSD